MNKKTIKITSLIDLKNFLLKARSVEGDVLVSHGRYTVDGKSILGLMSIDISMGCIVEYPETATEFDNFLAPFEI